MFDEKEIEELCDEFRSLDGNMFLESLEDISKLDEVVFSEMNLNVLKKLPNLKNNNFICVGTSGVDLDKPDACMQLDRINENSISLSTFERRNNSENIDNVSDLEKSLENSAGTALLLDKKENEIDYECKEVDEKLTSPNDPVGKDCFHPNGWTTDNIGLWRSGPSSLNLDQCCNNYTLNTNLTSSLTYNSNDIQPLNTFLSSSKRIYSQQQLGAKVEMVYSLLSMLDTNNREDMSKTFLAMSSSPESCHAMRQSGCLPLLIQLIHSSELNREVRERAAEALYNIVHSQADEKRRKREVRVLKLLQQVREYCDELKNICPQEFLQFQESEKHPINAVGTLMKFSFDAEHRQAICILGGLHTISELIQVDYEAHGNTTGESNCVTLRRYAGMSLTNLTFGDCKNKALLCSFNKFMCALVAQLKSPCEDLRQVTASVLRNLSWRADSDSKQALRDVGAVTALTISAMEGKKESTLKSILSALWNLSAHCSSNKADICSVPGALAFLVKMLKYKSSSNTLAIVENAGGILRNVSSHIAIREDYRQILRENNCFEVLLEQLKSPSLTIVSNACGTLWNLSARCTEDQKRLWEMGATSMLRSLVQSKHKMISMGSSAALKNLLAANPNENLLTHLDSTAKSLGLQNLPTLFVRKKRALEQELNITLAETCDNIDSIESPILNGKTEMKKANGPKRSESRDSVQSTQSDSTYERINQISLKNDLKLLENKSVTLHDSLDEKSMLRKLEDQKLMRRYKSSMIPTPTFKKVNQDRINEITREEHTLESTESELIVTNDFEEVTHLVSKQTNKNGAPPLNAKQRSIRIRNCEGSSPNDFFSQSNEECSVKSKGNEIFEAEAIENVEKCISTDAILNPFTCDKPVTPGLIREENTGKKSNTVIQNGFTEKGREHERIQQSNEKHANLRSSKESVCETGLLNAEKNGGPLETSCENYISKEFYKKVNPSQREITENISSERRFSDNDSLSPGDRQRITTCVINNENFTINHSASDASNNIVPGFREEHSQNEPPLELDPKVSISEDSVQSIRKEMLSAFNSVVPNSGKFSPKKVTPKVQPISESNNTAKIEESQSNFLRDKHLQNSEQDDVHETPFNNFAVQENRCETSGEESHTLVARFINLSRQSCSESVSSLNLEDRDSLNQKVTHCITDSLRVVTGGEPSSTYYSSADSTKITNVIEVTEPKPTEIPIDSVENISESTLSPKEEEELEMLSIGNAEGGHLKTLSGGAVPKFKVGSPITDSKVLQVEANKICREIRKHQEMGCSLTSEVSLVSCSSFIDTADYSLFDSSTDATDLEDTEYLDFARVSSRFKNLPLRKAAAAQTSESVSLPSLDSLKNEQIENLDLDSSILSVASISSEIAETYSKDLESFRTYTKTYEIDARNDLEDTLAEGTLISNGDDTLNADSIQNNLDLFDDDNSIRSQENLPLDTENFEKSTSDQMKKKLTPKEKRKTFHERYRTYTIRDFGASKGSEMTSAISCQGPTSNSNKDEISVSYALHCSQDQPNDNKFNDCFLKFEDERKVSEEKQFSPSRTFSDDGNSETFLVSKKLAKAQDLIPEFRVTSQTANPLLNIGPAERKELVDNAKLVAFSLKTAVQDYDLISDFETGGALVEFDTATYTKSFRDRHPDRSGSQATEEYFQRYEASVEEDGPEIKGARIFKPNEHSDGKVEELPKGIRGRRKPLYSSTQKNLLRTNGSPVNLPKTSQMVIDTKKPLNNCLPPTLQREGTFTKEDRSALKKNEIKNSRTIPVMCRNVESKSLNAGRGPCRTRPTGNLKYSGENLVSKIGRPVSAYANKSNERRPESDSSQKRSFSAEAGNRYGGESSATIKKLTSTGLASPKMRNSSNQNVKVGNTSGNGFFIKSKNSALQNSKSQSDANLNLVIGKDRGKQKNSRKEVTSKIASLWRKVEESKQKNKTSHDNRVWISSDKNAGGDDEVLVVEQEEILDIPNRRIVHSLTCQALSGEVSVDVISQEGNSRPVQNCAKFGDSEEKCKKFERRKIISAVVQPYNYNPPVSEKSTPSKIRQVDSFHKDSLKVTKV